MPKIPMLSCPCGFTTFSSKELVDHMFANCHAMSEEICAEQDPELKKELEEALSGIQLGSWSKQEPALRH